MEDRPGGAERALRLLAALLVALVLLVVGVTFSSASGARIEGSVTGAGGLVPGARVVLTISPSNEEQVRSIGFVRPRERMAVADDKGHYAFDDVRTDATLAIFALPPNGKGGVMMADVRAEDGETTRLDLSIPTRDTGLRDTGLRDTGPRDTGLRDTGPAPE
jgi:hypothetical protein